MLNGEIRFDPDEQIAQYVLRPGISYAVNDRLDLSGGYRYGQSLREGPDQVETGSGNRQAIASPGAPAP